MNQESNEKEQKQTSESQLTSEEQSRRELATKLGRFAIYAAPFTVMAVNSQAKSGSGPVRGKP